jgi:heptosyltransferase II
LNNTFSKIDDFKRIVIIQTAFIGDVALALPLTTIMKQKNPDAKITFVTTPAAASLVSCCSSVDNIITYDKRNLHKGYKGIKYIAGLLKNEESDCIICLHRSLRSSLVSYLSGVKFTVGYEKAALSFLFKNRIKYQKQSHEISRNLSFLSVFSGIYSDDSFPEVILDFSEDDTGMIDLKLKKEGIKGEKPLIVLAPGSVWETKKWKEEYFAELAVLMLKSDYQVVLTGSDNDKELCKRIAEKSGALNFAGQTTIPQTLILLSKSSLVVTNDSAPTHFAGLAGAPVITIYGPTSPGFGFAPTGKYSKVIENNELKCRPCRIHGSRKCPVKTHVCMTSISPQSVYEESKKLMEKACGSSIF